MTTDSTSGAEAPTRKKPKPHAPHVKLEITSNIIERSIRENSNMCVIAEAIKEAVPDAANVTVDFQSCRFTDPKKQLRYVYLTPRRGQEQLLKFDLGQRPEPFQIKLANGHVFRAGVRPAAKLKAKQKIRAKREAVGGDLSKTETRASDGEFRRVGGKLPPGGKSLKKFRRFGLRAFTGFSTLPEDNVATES